MKANSNTQAMGTEKIPKLLAQLAIPAVVAQVVNLLYNIVDRIYIGHISGIGASALTGVGLFTPILMLLNAFAMLAGSGEAPILSISFTTSLARYGGDMAVGAMTIINSVSQLVTMPIQGICQGGQPIRSLPSLKYVCCSVQSVGEF